MFRLRAAALALLVSAGCGGGSGTKSPGTGGTTGGSAGTTGSAGSSGSAGATGSAGTSGNVDAGVDAALIPFEQQVLDIAAEYMTWGRVDDQVRWAPGLCAAPLPGVAYPSTSDDPTTHGQKLYSLFAKNWAAYPNGPHDGQAVVKQSWKVEQVDSGWMPKVTYPTSYDADHFYPYAKGPDGGVFHATEPAGLFVMFKLDPSTPETDEGWVYATVSTEGRVTSAGRVSNCLNCHETGATHERLFGISSKSPSF
jgi:hypothetical protein